MNQISFVSISNDLLHQLRDRINNSEDKTDLRNSFAYTTREFLERVFENSKLPINDESFRFDPKAKDYFVINRKLKNNSEFKFMWENSDLPNLIGKFALSTFNRYKHLNKHPEKTNLKIRN